MIDYDKVQDSIIDSLVSDSSKWLEDEKKEVYSNERVVGNTISKDLVTNVFDYIMKKSCGNVISDIPGIGFINDVMSDIKDNNDDIENNQKIDDEILMLEELRNNAQNILKYSKRLCVNMQIVSVNGKYKIERYNIDKEALEDILEQYNEYCNEKKCNQENTSTLTIEDISNYFEGSAEKSEEIQAFLNANPNLY